MYAWILQFAHQARAQVPFDSLTSPKDAKLTGKLRQYDVYAEMM